MNLIKHYINGKKVEGGDRRGNVFNPAIGEVASEVILGNKEVVENAISISKRVLTEWREITPAKRANIMFNYKNF